MFVTARITKFAKFGSAIARVIRGDERLLSAAERKSIEKLKCPAALQTANSNSKTLTFAEEALMKSRNARPDSAYRNME